MKAAVGLTNHLRSPATPGNQVATGEQGTEEETSRPLGVRFRALSTHLARIWALAAGSSTLAELRQTAAFYEEVRVWMGTFDAQERQASGRPVPAEAQLLLAGLVSQATAAGEIVDIYAAVGIPKPTPSDLTPKYAERAAKAPNAHLAATRTSS